MATDKQIAANRLNAQKTTGPRTPEGRAAVRLNGVTHGLTAQTLVLKGEGESDFKQLSDDALLRQCRDLRLKIVTHEVEFVPTIFFGGMNCHLRRRQREDQPSVAGVHGYIEPELRSSFSLTDSSSERIELV
jgi:predicted metallopeptidase